MASSPPSPAALCTLGTQATCDECWNSYLHVYLPTISSYQVSSRMQGLDHIHSF